MEIMAREVDKITATVVIEIDVRTGWPKTQMTIGGGGGPERLLTCFDWKLSIKLTNDF